MQHPWRRKKKVVEQLNAFLRLNGQEVKPVQPAPQPAPATPPPPPQQPTKINYGNFAQSPAAQSTSLKNLRAAALQAERQSPNASSQQVVNQQSAPTSPQSAPIDKNAFLTAWKLYSQGIARTETRLYNLMITEPEIHGDEIVVKVQNQYQISDIAGNPGLTTYLRNTLKNTRLYITAVVDDKPTARPEVVYTSRQQFEKMCEQNKELARLAENWGFFLDS